MKKTTLSIKQDPAFSLKGYNKRNNAFVSFECLQNSENHYHVVTRSAHKATPIESQLSRAWTKQDARHHLQNIVGSV